MLLNYSLLQKQHDRNLRVLPLTVFDEKPQSYEQISGSAKVRNKWITPELYKVLNANKKPYLNFLEGTPMRPTSKVV